MQTDAIAHRGPLPPFERAADALAVSPPGAAARFIRRAASVSSDLVMLLALVVSIPFIVLAIGLPIVLLVQVVFQIGRML